MLLLVHVMGTASGFATATFARSAPCAPMLSRYMQDLFRVTRPMLFWTVTVQDSVPLR